MFLVVDSERWLRSERESERERIAKIARERRQQRGDCRDWRASSRYGSPSRQRRAEGEGGEERWHSGGKIVGMCEGGAAVCFFLRAVGVNRVC